MNKLLIAGERVQKQQHKSQLTTYNAEKHMPVRAMAEEAEIRRSGGSAEEIQLKVRIFPMINLDLHL